MADPSGPSNRSDEVTTGDEARRGIRIHASVTVAVSVLLVVVNIATPTVFPWAIFPIAGMCIGLGVHWYFATHPEPARTDR